MSTSNRSWNLFWIYFDRIFRAWNVDHSAFVLKEKIELMGKKGHYCCIENDFEQDTEAFSSATWTVREFCSKNFAQVKNAWFSNWEMKLLYKPSTQKNFKILKIFWHVIVSNSVQKFFSEQNNEWSGEWGKINLLLLRDLKISRFRLELLKRAKQVIF